MNVVSLSMGLPYRADPPTSAVVAVILASDGVKLAGMDGNRTHPGRLNSAPQTVLKNADYVSTSVRLHPLEFDRQLAYSTVLRARPLMSASLAVILAVGLAVNRSLHPVRKPRSVTLIAAEYR